MLLVVVVLTVIASFMVSPNLNFLETLLEHELEIALGSDNVDIEKVNILWNEGPVLDVGRVKIESGYIKVINSEVSLTYSFFQVFRGDFAPNVILNGGVLSLNIDKELDKKSSPMNVTTNLRDVQVDWVYKHEKQSLKHVHAEIMPYASHVSLIADGVQVSLSLLDGAVVTKARVKLEDIRILPESYQNYFQNITAFTVNIDYQSERTWSWNFKTLAEKGGLNIPSAHFSLPFNAIEAEGNIKLMGDKVIKLEQFNASKLTWDNGKNFGAFTVNWSNDTMQIIASDGSTSMPLLWSWLWMLGDDEWHDWLSSMKSGRISDVRATVNLDWVNPINSLPTHENLLDMKYHVIANAKGLDMALGLGGDFLYQLEGQVLVDESHLEASIDNAILKDGIAKAAGTYSIDWETLLMTIKAEGFGDVGKLHLWLDADSAKELNWGESLASAVIDMEWDANKPEPNKTIVTLMPLSKPWELNYNGVAMKGSQGEVVWDFGRGLDIKHMQVVLPWLSGDFSMFLDKEKDWDVSTIIFDGAASLIELTDTFELPITNPKGMTSVHTTYVDKKWQGVIDLTANDWDNFAGYDKEDVESLTIPFNGVSVGKELLPVDIQSLKSTHEDFSFDASIYITNKHLNFQFKGVDSSAFRGDFTLFMPLDATEAWKLDVDSEYVNKPLLTSYLGEKEQANTFMRPWTVNGKIQWVEWEKSTASEVYLKLSSDKESVGDIRVGYFLSNDLDLENVHATFSMDGKGKYDLHHFVAYGSGQKLQASGTVETLKEDVLKWKGLILMDGKFGTLMEQAELDKLFQEGDMSSVIIGEGEYKDGEPWWRKMKGSFKLSVKEGRIMEGGTLTHLLAAISLVDLPKYLIFDRGDVVGEGLYYDKLQVEALFESNKLNVQKLGFLSSALDAGGKGVVDLEDGSLDIVLVARPWQNVEVFISKIPLLGSILTGEDKSLKRAIYRIHGPASDAAVDEVSAEEVGLPKGGYLEDLFTPSRWFEPRKKAEEKVQ